MVVISRSIDSEEWERVECEILESTVVETKGEGTDYSAFIKYEYFVGGLTYKGNTVRFGQSFVLKSDADRICQKYPKSAIARVSIDPENPHRSVLIPGISPSIYTYVLFFIVFLAIGVGVLLTEIAK